MYIGLGQLETMNVLLSVIDLRPVNEPHLSPNVTWD